MYQVQEKLSGQSISQNNILVYGFYNHKNLGDDLFIDAFKLLFPTLNFTFTDKLTEENLKTATAVFIGGGSFLSNKIEIKENAKKLLKTKKIFYIGVGAETDIHEDHLELLKIAKLVALRSNVGIEKIPNNNIFIIPDIVYSLSKTSKIDRKKKSVLILPNIYTIPQNLDAHWKHSSWERFKFEFSQFLDYIVEDGYSISFFSMCDNKLHSDDNAAYEIISNMMHRNNSYIIKTNDFNKLFSSYETVITQRYHGIILSEINRTNYISIYHHDKLKSSYLNEGKFISFYACCRRQFIDEFYSISNIKMNDTLAIEPNIFKSTTDAVLKELNEICWDKKQ